MFISHRPNRRVPLALSVAFTSIAVFGALFIPQVLEAQNHRARPIYGSIARTSPFTPDPIVVQVNAGGDVNARDLGLGINCRGFITSAAPLISFNYEAGRVPLQVWVHAPVDTTLIIRDPSGKWHCDDDSLAKNPAIRFAQPKSGEYDIWVGVFGSTRPMANVHITER